MESSAVIQLNNLRVGYDSHTLLTASACLGRGELCALIGRNGTGKSTLLRLVAGITRAQKGEVAIEGCDLHNASAAQLARLVSFVSTERINVTNLTARDVVSLGRTPYTNWLGALSRNDRHIVEQAMERLSIRHLADKPTSAMSDGENARVMIARALAQQTPVILLDEPTAFLDIAGKYELCEILGSLAADGKTILFSSHDLATVWSSGCSIALIHDGKLHHGTAEQMRRSSALADFFSEAGFSMDFASGTLRRVAQPEQQ